MIIFWTTSSVVGVIPSTVNDPDNLSDLGRLALAAYNHGEVRVILTKHKAYLVTSDIEELDEADARAGQ